MTVTGTAVEVVVWPVVSRATAVIEWLPLPTVVVSQEREYGAEVSSLPRSTAPRRNWTPATPTSSEAAALTETVPLTLAPEAGAVTDTPGG